MPADFTHLQTIVRNTSGHVMYFPFLPPHGRTLPANGQARVAGNLFEFVADKPAKRRGLRYALEHDLIEIVSTPAPIVYDDVFNRRFAIGADNNQLVLVAPSWEQAFSEVDKPLTNA